jgi:hypothetical protein
MLREKVPTCLSDKPALTNVERKSTYMPNGEIKEG